MLVDLNTLVRDLAPVLKNVVGADVEVALPDTSTPLNVDVNIERIERLLVNLASYGRGRMPAGGRLRIELGTSVVDRHFSAKHPNVRLGLHALITVTESRRAGSEEDVQSPPRTRKAAGPGVDFATLQGLVSDCGGHLWMKVHPHRRDGGEDPLAAGESSRSACAARDHRPRWPRASGRALVSIVERRLKPARYTGASRSLSLALHRSSFRAQRLHRIE